MSHLGEGNLEEGGLQSDEEGGCPGHSHCRHIPRETRLEYDAAG
jgi:hypothetical protein